jgi:hypothetical protein
VRTLGLLAVAALGLLVLTTSSSAQEESWKVQGGLNLMAGQYFYNDSAGSVDGYADGDLLLLRSLTTASGFYLDFHGSYTGFKQVNELAGGGTLFQQSADGSVEAKWVQRFSDGFSLKPRVEVEQQLFRETKDESWGKGLYDFWRYSTGVVWEHKTRLNMEVPWIWQFSYDLYYTHYPRFQSLTSQFGTEQSAPDPGSRILDTVTNQFAYRSEFDLPGFVSLWGLYSVSFISFTDQKVVQAQGQFLGTNRSDSYQSLTFGSSKRLNDWLVAGRVRPVVGLKLNAATLLSNQNSFDADPSRLKYIGAYYDYWETHVTPSLSATFLTPQANLTLAGDFGYRKYTGRLTQNADGSYTGAKLHQFSEAVSLNGSYPIWKGLSAKASATWSNSSANTAYEQTYQYNYHDYNYFAGVGWQFY